MYPVALDISHLPVGLAGRGEAFGKRLAQLLAQNPKALSVFCDQPDAEIEKLAGPRLLERLPLHGDLKGLRVLMVAGLPDDLSEELSDAARKQGVLVNVEDVPHLSDFYFMSLVTRGELQIAVSTGGTSPALASILREHLEKLFDERWKDYTALIADKRREWKRQGLGMKEILLRTRTLLHEKGWLHSFNDETRTERPSSLVARSALGSSRRTVVRSGSERKENDGGTPS